MAGTGVDRPRGELLAVEIRHRLDLGHGYVDPFKIAVRLGLEVVRYPVEDGSVEGIYRPIPGGGGAILVNSKSQYLRQRFTVAHEIGHSQLHADQTFVDDELTSKSAKGKEREADRFAGALLVDRKLATEIIARHQGDVDAAVAEVVGVFRVNRMTAVIQLQQYGLISQEQCDGFEQRWAGVPLWEFMARHGKNSPHRNGDGQMSVDRRYKTRVLKALAEGQLTPDRAADFLASTPDRLPKWALTRRNTSGMDEEDEDLVFDLDAL